MYVCLCVEYFDFCLNLRIVMIKKEFGFENENICILIYGLIFLCL